MSNAEMEIVGFSPNDFGIFSINSLTDKPVHRGACNKAHQVVLLYTAGKQLFFGVYKRKEPCNGT